ncbi:MAG: hypothetical protein JWO22_1342, partial [Frankiales bacterium]|nr:hypothetical protein [Frankiales bacterium]
MHGQGRSGEDEQVRHSERTSSTTAQRVGARVEEQVARVEEKAQQVADLLKPRLRGVLH